MSTSRPGPAPHHLDLRHQFHCLYQFPGRGFVIGMADAGRTAQHRERGIDVGANAYTVKSSLDQSNWLEIVGRRI